MNVYTKAIGIAILGAAVALGAQPPARAAGPYSAALADTMGAPPPPRGSFVSAAAAGSAASSVSAITASAVMFTDFADTEDKATTSVISTGTSFPEAGAPDKPASP